MLTEEKAEFLLEQNQLNSQIYLRSEATPVFSVVVVVACLFVCLFGCVVLDEFPNH